MSETISNETISNMQEIITDQAANVVKNIVKPSLAELKQSASHFLEEANTAEIRIAEIENMLQRQHELRQGLKKAEYEAIDSYIESRNKIRENLKEQELRTFFSEVISFQQTLNNFIGQDMEMIFVWVDSDNTPSLYHMKNEDLLRADYSAKDRVIGRYYANQSQLENALERIDLGDEDSTGYKNLVAAYKEVLDRRSTHPRTRRAMWLNPYSDSPKWHVAKIAQIGDVNEAFAAITLTHQEALFATNSNIDNNIEIFMVLFWSQVDTASGLLQGDVEIGNLELGIKSAGATMLSINQVIEIAQQIINEDITEETIKQIKEQLKANAVTRNTIEEGTEDFVEANLEELRQQAMSLAGVNMIISY